MARDLRVIKRDPDCEGDWSAMEFRLTYEGLLLGASRDSKRAAHKHEIRKVFHKQLGRLFGLHPAFSNMAPVVDIEDIENLKTLDPVRYGCHQAYEKRANNFHRCGYRFFPLVTRETSVLCAVHVLFLRPDQPGGVIRSGDIDNRIKTLFDALKTPASKDELGGYDQPAPDEDPFFCLLEDDSLISHASIETDTLLQPVGERWNDNDVRLILTVRINPYTVTWANIGFA